MARLARKLRVKGWKKTARDFRFTILICFLVVSLSSVLYALILAFNIHPWDWGASRANPLGLLTSTLVHGSFVHLRDNMVLLTFFASLFILVNLPYSSHERQRRDLFFAVTILPAAVAADILFVVLTQGTTVGASGIAYASLGVAFGFSITHLSHELGIRVDYRRGKTTQPRGLSGGWIYANLLVFIPFFAVITFQPQQFLGVREGVNAFGHGVAFLIAFVATMVYARKATDRYEEGARMGSDTQTNPGPEDTFQLVETRLAESRGFPALMERVKAASKKGATTYLESFVVKARIAQYHINNLPERIAGGIAERAETEACIFQAKAALDNIAEAINQVYGIDLRPNRAFSIDELGMKRGLPLEQLNPELHAFIKRTLAEPWYQDFKAGLRDKLTHRGLVLHLFKLSGPTHLQIGRRPREQDVRRDLIDFVTKILDIAESVFDYILAEMSWQSS